MMTREQIQELAQFEDEGTCALSFYFQPPTPRNKAHKEEAILTKDLVREALRQLEGIKQPKGKSEAARADLEHILRFSQELRGNGVHAKAVFACSAQGIWREYDLPAYLNGTQLFLDRHFHIKPLTQLLALLPSLGILLIDRRRARLFELRIGELSERLDFFHPLPHRGRGDGFKGYDAGHAERHVAEEVRQHFKSVAEFLKDALDKGLFEHWVLGCQETHWQQFEAQLHPYALQKLLGRFTSEVAHASRDQIRSHAESIFAESQKKRCEETVRETLSQARSSNGRGVTGLRRVLRSLESGEVQTLLVGQTYHAQAVECSGCGHLDAHLVNFCPVCGRQIRGVVDASEAILPRAIRHNIELLFVKDDPEFDKVGNIAALLRFRSEQNDNSSRRPIASAAPNPSVSRPPGRVGRYRGVASS
jgi:peptide subunit release factor 1 (eRF1)